MKKQRLLPWVASAAAFLVLMACGGGSGDRIQPTEEASPPKDVVETATPEKIDIDDLTDVVVMVAPGVFDGGDFVPVATGSGTIVDHSGLILTNYHVVDPMGIGAYEDIAIYVTDDPKETPKLTYFGGLAAWDEDLDLAVIRITENRNGVEIDVDDLDLKVVSIGDADDLNIGDALTVLGYPAVGEGSLELTRGAVSGFLAAEGQKDAWIKTDARIASGNSGGGAFDETGKLVGIPTAIYYVEGLGGEESGRVRPVNLANELLREARAAKEVVIPQIEEPAGAVDGVDVQLLSESDLGGTFVLGWETYLSNEDRAAFYDDPEEALSFYEEHGRIGGVRRVFDDFDSADVTGASPNVIVVQVDVYETAEGASGAVSSCDEFLDTMWEFVTDMGFEFYEPEPVDGPQIGDESCLYSAEEDVGTEDIAPLKLTFVGFRQGNALAIVGMFTMTDYDLQTPVLLAQAQSALLAGTIPPDGTSGGQPTPEDAIAAFLYGYGIEYVGDCAYADLDRDVGRYCSTAYEDRGSSVIYVVGLTFSEYDTWVLTEQNPDGSWRVADSTDVTYDLSGDVESPPW